MYSENFPGYSHAAYLHQHEFVASFSNYSLDFRTKQTVAVKEGKLKLLCDRWHFLPGQNRVMKINKQFCKKERSLATRGGSDVLDTDPAGMLHVCRVSYRIRDAKSEKFSKQNLKLNP